MGFSFAYCYWQQLISILLLVAASGKIFAFNVDTEMPSIYRAGSERSTYYDRPERRSMFGYSIAQHITHQGLRRLLVGAPRANTSQLGVTEAGAVYDCGFVNPGSKSLTCTVLEFDRTGNKKDDLGDGLGPQPMEEKSKQWFGATVTSARNAVTGDAMACAPYYIYFSQNLDKRLPIGHCFHYRGSRREFKRLNPIKNTVDYYTMRDSSAMEQFTKEGKAMYGIAATLGQSSGRILAGAVGSFSWKGRLYAHKIPPDYSRPATTFTKPFEDNLFSYAYMTYAVAVGNFTASQDEDFLVSAPRSGGLLPRGNDVLSGTLRIYNSSMHRQDLIIGENMGDYLGHSLAVGDFNGDGLDDLAAGAPFYGEKGSVHDTGRVWILYQRRLGVIYRKGKSIMGVGRAGEQFGFSLANIGDIDQDGFTDLAVGAPYGGINGQGAVYIFHGSSHGLKSKFSQMVDAADIDTGLLTFGHSLSGGLDMDNNGYPDLTVGSYASDALVQLWSRPVLRLYVNVTAPPSLDLKDTSFTLPTGEEVVVFPVQIYHRHEGKTPLSRVSMDMTVRLDAARDVAPRAYFHTTSGRATVYSQTVQILNPRGESSIDVPFKAYAKPGLRDKLSPIIVEVNYNVTVTVDDGLAEVLDANIPTTVRWEMHIEKDCGDDRTCVADLRMMAKGVTEEFRLGDSTIDIRVQVNNTAEDGAFEAQVSIQLPPDTTYVKVHTVKTPVSVKCYPYRINTVTDDDGQGNSVGNTEEGPETVVCEIGNPLPGFSEVEFILRLDARNIDGSLDHLAFNLNASSANPENDTTMGDNWADLSIPVKAVTPIRLTGISKPEQVLFSSNDSSSSQKKKAVDSKITHLYELRNLGPSTIETASVVIYWPSRFEDEDGDDLFVLTDPPKVKQGQQITNCSITSSPAPSQNVSVEVSRKKRNTPNFAQRYLGSTVVNRAVVCKPEGGEAWCSVISCQVATLEADERALIEVNAHLSAKSLSQLPHMTILVTSQAVAQVKSVPYEGVKAGSYFKINRVDTILATKGAGQGSVKIWVIGVSVAGGLLLLVIIVVILYLCGFFKRNKYSDEDMLNSVDDDEGNDRDDEVDGGEADDLFPEGEAGNRNSRIDTINRKLILQNGISLSIEEKR